MNLILNAGLNFDFCKDVYKLFEDFGISKEITCFNRSKFSAIEAFCVFLKSSTYPWHGRSHWGAGSLIIKPLQSGHSKADTP